MVINDDGGGGLSAKSYVQDGLVAMWDGIENAGWGQHDANATVWKDLIGTNDFNLENCTFDVFQDSLQVTDGEAVAEPLLVNMVETVEVVALLGQTVQAYPPAEFISWPRSLVSSTYQRCFGLSQESRKTIATGASGTARITFDFVPTPNVPFSLSASWVAGMSYSETLVANGENKTRGAEYHYVMMTLDKMKIWNKNGTTLPRVFNLRVYSRALTADEIAANYAVDKARFNLPDAT